jgi:hypothetical protein
MAATGAPKSLALDTNLLMDLAKGADFAHEFMEVFREKGYALRLPPTAAAELHEQFRHGPTLRQRSQARVALLNLRQWGIQPLDLADVELSIAEEFAKRLLRAGLLPAEEYNDALILGETSMAQIPLVVTSDKHLLDMDEEALLLLFNEADLAPVRAAHPKRLLRALR